MNKTEFDRRVKCNGMLGSFQAGSGSEINNFLHDMDDPKTKTTYIDVDIDSAMEEMFSGKSDISKFTKSFHNPVIYMPITKDSIEALIDLDELFSASKEFNTKPITVYRGAPKLTESALSGIVSTSLDLEVAIDFYKGSIIKINLPAGFPYINLTARSTTFSYEQEVILPPCNFKVIKKSTLPHMDFPERFPNYYNLYELDVEPLSLAECMLNRMENPPKEYIRNMLPSKKKDFKFLKSLLKEYVHKCRAKVPNGEDFADSQN